jgi:hypothetical protein
MVRSVVCVAVLSALLVSGAAWPAPQAVAQSILKRLEQDIRQRVAEDRAAAAQPAADPPHRDPGYLGAVVDDRQDRGRGVRVLDVRPEGPADVGGLRAGDLITGVAGVRVRQTEDLADVMAVFPPDSRVAFDVLRQGQVVKIDVVLGHRDPSADTPLPQPESVPRPLPEPVADPVEPGGQPAAPLKLMPPQAEPSEAAARPDAKPAEGSTRAADPPELEQLQARIAELERRVEQLERALADSLKQQ